LSATAVTESLGEWMSVREMPNPSGTTQRWEVLDRHGGTLGEIHWYGQWRQYAFICTNYAVFNKGCLRDISNFLEEQMRLWRESRRKTKT
jgi:hypothetical protein